MEKKAKSYASIIGIIAALGGGSYSVLDIVDTRIASAMTITEDKCELNSVNMLTEIRDRLARIETKIEERTDKRGDN